MLVVGTDLDVLDDTVARVGQVSLEGEVALEEHAEPGVEHLSLHLVVVDALGAEPVQQCHVAVRRRVVLVDDDQTSGAHRRRQLAEEVLPVHGVDVADDAEEERGVDRVVRGASPVQSINQNLFSEQ